MLSIRVNSKPVRKVMNISFNDNTVFPSITESKTVYPSTVTNISNITSTIDHSSLTRSKTLGNKNMSLETMFFPFYSILTTDLSALKPVILLGIAVL